MTATLTAPDGTALAVESSGTGPPVVFVHGSNGGLHSWAGVAEHLTGHRVVRYSRRNHAPSGVGASPNDFAIEAADLHAVIAAVTDAAGAGAHVVGASYGATVALHAAAADDARIASLALFEPPLLLSGPHLATVLDRYRTLCAAARFADALTLFLSEVARIPPEILTAGPAVPDSEPAAVAAGADLEAMSRDGTDAGRWSVVDVLVLLMQGGQSWSPLPEGVEQLASALPHVERVSWSDQAHFATSAAPTRVAAAIQRFLGTPG